jgi:hypothetical protein
MRGELTSSSDNVARGPRQDEEWRNYQNLFASISLMVKNCSRTGNPAPHIFLNRSRRRKHFLVPFVFCADYLEGATGEKQEQREEFEAD